ncbi:MAG: hypothetical protein ACR2P3_01900 [Geminicoccaceae bacterium]
MENDEKSFVSLRDGAVGGLVSLLALASWTFPEAGWHAFARRLAWLRIARRGPLSPDERAMIEIITGDRPASWIEETFWPETLGHKYLSWMQILACHRPRRWQPTSRLIGKEHVDQALAGGRGVVLFTATFAYKDLMAKAAFAAAGYAVSHLSMDTHGFSDTRFGKRWLNPIYTSVEERFLRERMVFSDSNTKAVSAKMRERLKQNAPVMITVTPLGRKVASRSFLHGYIHVATGGLNLACESGTPVLPVFTLRQADGGMTTFVGRALDQPLGASRTEVIDALLDDYVPRLESHVISHPDQFSFPLSDRFGKPLLSQELSPPVARKVPETEALAA